MTLPELEALLLADVAKAPTLLADAAAIKTAVETLLTDAGVPIPWAPAVITQEAAHFEANVAEHKLGDGTILKGLGTFLQSPLGQALLQLLLGKLGGTGGTTTP